MRKIVFLMLVGILLTGCGGEQSIPTPVTTQTVMPTLTPNVYKVPTRPAITFEPPATYPAILTDPAKELIQRRWLQGIPCKAPCWEGITPGKTTVDEALTILRNNAFIGKIEVSTNSLIRLKGRITWKWNYNSSLGGSTGGAAFDPKDPQQNIIGISPGYESFFFRDIITAYGEPNYIWASVSTSAETVNDKFTLTYFLRVVYLDQGFTLDIGRGGKPNLSLDLPLSHLEFFEPTLAGYFAASDSKSLPLAWEGFKGFDYYCRYTGNTLSSDCKNVTG